MVRITITAGATPYHHAVEGISDFYVNNNKVALREKLGVTRSIVTVMTPGLKVHSLRNISPSYLCYQ